VTLGPQARVVWLGPQGTFSEQAMRLLPELGPGEPVHTVADALELVRCGDADLALVPFENSLEGSVAGTLDSLADPSAGPLHITREVLLPVAFAVLVRPGTTLADVRSISTIGPVEAQCREWLRTCAPGIPVTAASSSAAAAQAVARGEYDAALGSAVAAERTGLVVLQEGIGDRSDTVTRFVLLARPAPPPPPTGVDRTTVVLFEREDHPGALLEMLTEFAVRGVNLTRLESRPTGEGLGSYCFAVECVGHVSEAHVGEALSALRRVCREVIFLGSYPRADRAAGGSRRPGTTAEDFADAAAWLAALRGGSCGGP
jgi:prephenate dehydratase